MEIKFKEDHPIAGYLEKIYGSHLGLKLPLHYGINFIGRTKDRCEYENHTDLAGIIEGAQIYLRVDDELSIADATSTNQSKIFRKHQVKNLCYADLYEMESYIEVKHEMYETILQDRIWYKIYPEDIICHIYGYWTFRKL